MSHPSAKVRTYLQDRPADWLRENPNERWRCDIFPDDGSNHYGVGRTEAEALYNASLAYVNWVKPKETERRIFAALEPAPVTAGEAARNDAKVALEQIEAVEDAYTRWMLAHAVGDANLIHRDSNALSHALFSMFNSDPDDGPSEVTRALRALADAGEAG